MTPSHYTHTKIEPIKVINSINLGFNLGSAYKYLARAGYKESYVADLKKAIDFIGFESKDKTFFCNDIKLQRIRDFMIIESENKILVDFLNAIKNEYLFGANYLESFILVLNKELQKSTKTPTTKD